MNASLKSYLLHSHDDFASAFHLVLDAMAAGAPEITARWSELESGLRAHLEAEERYLLPGFVRVDRDETLGVLRDHGAIRELLLDLGAAVEQRASGFARAQEFVTTMREHVAREERLMYRWADQHLPVTLEAAALQRAAAP